jgi:hypothetical protein
LKTKPPNALPRPGDDAPHAGRAATPASRTFSRCSAGSALITQGDEENGIDNSFGVLSTRHERGAIVLTSNLAFSEWNRVFVDDKLTAALLDRLAQHAEVLVTRGPGDRVPAPTKRSDPKDGGPALTP